MKKKNRLIFGLPAVVLAFSLVLAGCDDPNKESGSPTPPSPLSGAITISPPSGVTTGTLLTANYSGSETGLAYQWKKDGTAAGTGPLYTPAIAGEYTVTVSKAGYESKTSAAVTVTGDALSTLAGTVTIKKNGTDVTTANTGDTLTAAYSVNGETGLTYQWYKGVAAITIGGTSATYTPTAADSYTVTVSKTGYASKSATVTVTVPGAPPGVPGGTTYTIANVANLAAALAAITAAGKGTAASPKAYTLNFTADVEGTIELPLDVNFAPLTDIIVTLKGTGNKLILPTVIGGSDPSPLLSVNSGKKFIIDGLTLDGGTSTGYSNDLVSVTAGGTLELKSGAITNFKGGNTNAVSISGGAFTMSGGTISGNSNTISNSAGAVYVSNSSTFTMTGGEIKDNKNVGASPNFSAYGGGVRVSNTGTFIMSGGTISGNQSANYGGVYVDSNNNGSVHGTFTKLVTGGIIYGNNEAADDLKNTFSTTGNSAAAVLYRYSSSSIRKRNDTLNAGDTITTIGATGSGNGWL